MTTHAFQTSPGGIVAPDSTLAPPAVIETDPYTKDVSSMLRIHVQDAQLPAGCNPYAVVSVGTNSAHSKQLLSAENPALASTGYAFFDEQFVVEYDPNHIKHTYVSVAFFERTTNAPLGEWRAPISDYDHHSHGLLGKLKHNNDAGGNSWELLEGTNVSLAPYVGAQADNAHHGLLSHILPHHNTTTATTATTATTTTAASTTPFPIGAPIATTTTTTAPVAVAPVATGTTVPVVAGTAPVVAGTAPVVAGTAPVVAGTTASGATTTTAPLTSGTTASGALGTAHLRVRSEPKLIGTVKLGVKEVVLTTGNAGPLLLNIKFAAPEQKFTTAITPGASGRFAFATNEFLINVDPTNNVRDIFIEVIENGVVLGETRVTLYDAYRPSGLAAAQPILIHSTKSRIGEMLLTSSFDGKVQKR